MPICMHMRAYPISKRALILIGMHAYAHNLKSYACIYHTMFGETSRDVS